MDTYIACFLCGLLSAIILAVSITASVVKRKERGLHPLYDSENAGTWFGLLCSFIVSVVMFFTFAPSEFRDETVKDYIDGNIVKEVKYNSTQTDGEITQKDSTVTFILKKEK